jgi:hypothetical protein
MGEFINQPHFPVIVNWWLNFEFARSESPNNAGMEIPDGPGSEERTIPGSSIPGPERTNGIAKEAAEDTSGDDVERAVETPDQRRSA